MNQNNTQLYKGVLEICILQMINDGINYGYTLVESLKKSGFEVSPGTIYPILNRLKNDELVTTEYQVETDTVPRKIYSLTYKGESELETMKDSWKDYTKRVNKLLKVK